MPFLIGGKIYYLGVDLGGTTIKAGLFDEQLQLLKMVQKIQEQVWVQI